MAFAAFWGLHGTPQVFDGFPVFCGSSEDQFARDLLPVWYRYWQADLCITLMDVFALDPAQLQGMNLAHWMPVDCERLSEMDKHILANSPGRPVAMSRHGEKCLSDAGFKPLYAPHALDMEAWSPLEDRDAARAQLGWDDGRLVIGINAANQDPVRKAYPEQIEAFAELAKLHDDVQLVIHSRARTQQGADLESLIAYYGLQGKAGLGAQDAIAGGLVTEPMMVSWHGVIDVCSNTAYGEGFGLAILQSQACGTPVVANDCSAMRELCGAGWLTEGQNWWNKGHRSNWQVPFVTSILDSYEKAYAEARDPAVREQARQWALAYDAEKIYAECWEPILAELGSGRVVEHAGLRWRLGDSVDHGDRLGPAHEETVEQSVLDLLPDGGVFLDVGAHVGHYTLRAAKKAVKVIAVEPNPATATRLRDNLQLNGLGNVTVHQLAAWDKIERLRLESRDNFERSGDTTVTPDDEGTVTGIPLDRVLSGEDRIDLVKLDVEGADLHAIRGMAKTLARLRPVMVIEDHSVYGCYEKADLEALLGELGYDCEPLGMYGCAPYLVSRPVAVAVA